MLVVPSFANCDVSSHFTSKLTLDERCAIYCLHNKARVKVAVLARVFGLHRLTVRALASPHCKTKYKPLRDMIEAMGLDAAYTKYVTPEIEKRVEAEFDRMRRDQVEAGLLMTDTIDDKPSRRASRYAGPQIVPTYQGNKVKINIQYLAADDERCPWEYRDKVTQEMVRLDGWYYRLDGSEKWRSPEETTKPCRTSSDLYNELLKTPHYESSFDRA